MGELELHSHLPASVDQVWAWHQRPGAMARLLPPWQPLHVVQQATSLRDGTSVMSLPGGLRWTARHQPDGYLEHEQFIDILEGAPLEAVLRWRHVHRFAPDTPTGTLMTDRVRSSMPAPLLRPMLAFRGRQLADDLAALQRSTEWGAAPLVIGVTGSSGLVGRALCDLLTSSGHQVIRLVRRPSRTPDERRWDPADPAADLLDGMDALVHLAGEPIAGRFTATHRNRIRDSRIGPTKLLAERTVGGPNGPHVLVCASAIGYYGADRGDTPLIESSEPGDDFLADVVREWESATLVASEAGVRTVLLRTGIVQSPAGGALRLLRPIYRVGLGGPLGDGRMWQSWIGLDDLLDLYRRATLDQRMQGPVNAVAPHPVRGREYADTLGRVLRRPARLPVPAFGPSALLGREGARELALASQRVLPARLEELGHVFRYDDLEPALRHLLGAPLPPRPIRRTG